LYLLFIIYLIIINTACKYWYKVPARTLRNTNNQLLFQFNSTKKISVNMHKKDIEI